MIEAHSVSYSIGKFSLEDLNFRVDDNETMVILGPSGAGKTILMELLAGFRTPKNGDFFIDGKVITNMRPEKRRIGLLYQEYMLFPHLNVQKNIAYGLRAYHIRSSDREQRVKKLSKLLGIEQLLDRNPKTLSGGEQQRVALARTLIVKPKILLLDEPFSSVDPKTKDKLMRELKKILKNYDIPVLYVTHDQVEAMEIADRIAVMNDGKIIQIDYPDKIFSAPKSEFVADFVGIGNIIKGRATRIDGITEIDIDGLKIYSSIGLEGEVHVTLRPEDIIISRAQISSSARNSLKGEVIGVIEKGPVIYVTADCGIPVTAAITRESLREMNITIGDEIFMTFKAHNVNIF